MTVETLREFKCLIARECPVEEAASGLRTGDRPDEGGDAQVKTERRQQWYNKARPAVHWVPNVG